MEKPHTGLDDCLRMPQVCFRKILIELEQNPECNEGQNSVRFCEFQALAIHLKGWSDMSTENSSTKGENYNLGQ